MDVCFFCERPAEQGVWLRRWRVGRGPARQGVEDVRLSLCALHLRDCVLERRSASGRAGWPHQGWEYD